MVYAYTFSKVIDNEEIMQDEVAAILSKIAKQCDIQAFGFRHEHFSWGDETHDGVVVSFWTQYMLSEETTDKFAIKLNLAFEGAECCYLAQSIDGEIVKVFHTDIDGNVKIDRKSSVVKDIEMKQKT